MKNLSNSFASSSTRSLNEVNREIESRMTKAPDEFMDDFLPPGATQTTPAQDTSKRQAPYQDKHTDSKPEADPQFWQTGGVGDPKDQDDLDWLDELAHKFEVPIKKQKDQLPGDVDMKDHKEIAAFDPHLTDPRRLNVKQEKKLRVEMGPEEFHKTVEKRMKELANAEPAKFESPYQKKPDYNPEEDAKPSKSATYNVDKT